MKFGMKLVAASGLAVLMTVPAVEISPAFAQVDTIVVTSRKREENLQDVPLSVTAVTSNQIERGNYVGIEDVAQFVPGFEMDRSFQRSFERPVIRGKSIILTGAVENPASIFINGAFFDGTLSSIDLSEVERIEVIKGPQSALYGRATYAGAINVITKLPGDEFGARVSGTAAADDQYEVTAGFEGPIMSDLLSASVYLRHYEFGGQWTSTIDDRDLGQEKSQSIAATFRLTPADNAEIVARVVYGERDDGPIATNFHPFALNNYAMRANGTYDYFAGDLTLQPFTNNNAIAALFGDLGESEDHVGGSIQADWDVTDSIKVISNTSYDDFDIRFVAGPHEPNGGYRLFTIPGGPPSDRGGFLVAGFRVNPFIVNDRDEIQSFSQDLHVEYDDGGSFRAMFGGYYYDRDEEFAGLPLIFSDAAASLTPGQMGNIETAFQRAADLAAAASCAPIMGCDPAAGSSRLLAGGGTAAGIVTGFADDLGSRVLQGTRNVAVYGRLEWDVTDGITGTFEGRWAQDKKSTTSFDFGSPMDPQREPITDLEATFDSFTPRITLNWDVTDDSLAYVVVANGTKPGGFNSGPIAASQNQRAFNEEKVWSYEVGSKNTFFDGQLFFNVAGYYEDIKDYQLTDILVDESFDSPTEPAITNKGEVRAYGIELDVRYQPDVIEGLSFNLGYAFSENEFKGNTTDVNQGRLEDILDDGEFNCSIGDVTPMTPCVARGGADSVPVSINGQRTPLSSKHQLNAGVNLTRPVPGMDLDWFVQVDMAYEGKKFVQVHNLAVIPESVLVNMSVGIQHENFRLSFWGKNLTDDDAVASGTRFIEANAFFRRAFLTFPQRERQWGGTLTVTY